MRVLLIEDDKMIGTAVQQALKDAAYAVHLVRPQSMRLRAIRTNLPCSILGCQRRTAARCFGASARWVGNFP
jgi:DNA-binding response OmpR family regulator